MRYSDILESVLFPAYYRMRGRSYAARREFLERSQWWSAEQLRDFQWGEVQKLLLRVFRSVPYYQKKYAAAGIELGDIKTREDFAKLPALTREEIRVHRADLCAQTSQPLIPHATGGSSGVPTRFFITADSYDWRCAASARAYSWPGLRIGERALYLWGAPVGHVSQFKKAKLDAYRFFRRELVIPTFAQTPELWRSTFEAALRFRPGFVVGYVSSLRQFAEYLQERNLRIPGIQAVLAAAEPVYKPTRDLVAQAFQAPLFDTYGSREFMSISAECENRNGMHIHAENLLIETEMDSSKGPSELLVTDLHNFGMPFIRYRIGDLGLLSDTVCPCGRGLPLIRKIEGRILEVLRTRDGRIIPGEFFPHLLKDVGEIREYQVQQSTLDEVILFVVLARPLSERSEALLRQEIGKVFTPATRVTIRPVDEIPQLSSGKRRVSIGLAAAVDRRPFGRAPDLTLTPEYSRNHAN